MKTRTTKTKWRKISSASFIAIAFFTSCSVQHSLISNKVARQNNEQVKRDNTASAAGYTPFTSLQYIDWYKAVAIREMELYGVPASITLAQGLFESGSGNAELARVANNHFGIKATANWTGRVYYRDDDQKNDAFRVYDRPEDSFRDHSLFLKRKNYTPLFALNITDYKGWAQGLKKAGYATNPDYPSLLITVIEKYNLQQYDVKGGMADVKKQDLVMISSVSQDAAAARDSTTQNTVVNKTYTVKPGDTLYNISKRFGLTVDGLRAMNSLDGSNIKIGQVLLVAK